MYVAKLEPELDPKAQWYVGITSDFRTRKSNHFNDYGGVWTKRNIILGMEPIGRWETPIARKYENQLTKYLMSKFGVETTRGGDFASVELSFEEIDEQFRIAPELAELLKNCGFVEIEEAVGETDGVAMLVVEGNIPFSSKEKAIEWADKNLPPGTEFSIKIPGISKEGGYRSRPSESTKSPDVQQPSE